MEQKAKKYEELNKYERVMANASLEQKLEAMAKELQQISKALKIAVHLDSDYYDWNDTSGAMLSLIGDKGCTQRDLKEEGDFFGVIEEALAKETTDTDAS